MVAGRLQEKNGFYYIVLSYTDSAGKRRQPWIGTGLPVKGNKKRAEKMLAETRKDFTIPKGQASELSPDMAFSDYMRYWLKMMRTAVTETTYSSYCFNVEKHIIPYFEPLGVTLAGLQPRQIQSFYLHEAETLKNTSILRFHANLHKALKYAVRIDLITSNPVDKVDRPKPQAFMASYYSAEEMEKLFEAAQGHKLELIIQLAAFYGLRRAEVMGLRWEAIDFEAKTLTIRHIVTSTRIDGKKILVEADRAKTKSSLRTLPLVDPIAERLKAVKEQQEYNQKICGNCYNQEYLGYVFENGEDQGKPYDMEQPNFFGLSIAYDPYKRELVDGKTLTTCGGDGGCNVCGGMGPLLGYLPCSPHCKQEVREDNEIHNDYDFFRPVIRVQTSGWRIVSPENER